MHKKFEINQTKIKGGCQSGRKVVTHNSNSDLPLLWDFKIFGMVYLHVSCLLLEEWDEKSWHTLGFEPGTPRQAEHYPNQLIHIFTYLAIWDYIRVGLHMNTYEDLLIPQVKNAGQIGR